MQVVVAGMVMEVLNEEYRDDKDHVHTRPYFRLYQKGEKSMIDIKKIPEEVSSKYYDGMKVAFKCRVFPWKTQDGTINMSLSYVEDVTQQFNSSIGKNDNGFAPKEEAPKEADDPFQASKKK